MRLLIDHNLSHKLVGQLANEFPDSAHVYPLGMDEAEDLEVYEYAGEHGYAIVSKDDDFERLSRKRGAPPFVIKLDMGNSTTTHIAELLRQHRERMREARHAGKRIYHIRS